jgi:hypothetical protein
MTTHMWCCAIVPDVGQTDSNSLKSNQLCANFIRSKQVLFELKFF